MTLLASLPPRARRVDHERLPGRQRCPRGQPRRRGPESDWPPAALVPASQQRLHHQTHRPLHLRGHRQRAKEEGAGECGAGPAPGRSPWGGIWPLGGHGRRQSPLPPAPGPVQPPPALPFRFVHMWEALSSVASENPGEGSNGCQGPGWAGCRPPLLSAGPSLEAGQRKDRVPHGRQGRASVWSGAWLRCCSQSGGPH